MEPDKYININHFVTRKGSENSIDERLFISGAVERERKQIEYSRMRRNIYYFGIATSAVCAGIGYYLSKESDFRETLPFCMLLVGLAGTGFSYLLANRENEDVRMRREKLDNLKKNIYELSKN